jgi:predicted nucleotidyltransferase
MAADFVPPTIDSPALAEIIRRLVDTYHPERIYLFGSAARGESSPDSDYDLMVVVPNDMPVEQRDSGRAYRALHGVGVPADILVWTRQYFDDRHCLQASLSSTITREGRMLYAR